MGTGVATGVNGMTQWGEAVCEPMRGARSEDDLEEIGRVPPSEDDDEDASGTLTVLMTRL